MKAQLLSAFEEFYRYLAARGYDHPVHPTLVVMPIGLALAALVFLIVAILFRRPGLKVSARYCLILAFLFVFPTVAAGAMDWQCFYGGVWLFPIQAKVGLASALFVILILGIWFSRRPERAAFRFFLATLLAFCTAGALGYFGGDLVFGGRVPASEKGHQAGETLFSARCSGCHPYGGNMLKPEDSIIHSDKLRTPDIFIGWIRDPTPPMPPFRPEAIPDQQAHDLFDYLAEIWGGSFQNQPQPAPAPAGSPPQAAPAQGPSPQGPNP